MTRTVTVTTERLATHLRTLGAPGDSPHVERSREFLGLLLGFLEAA